MSQRPDLRIVPPPADYAEPITFIPSRNAPDLYRAFDDESECVEEMRFGVSWWLTMAVIAGCFLLIVAGVL